jgi:hypothetical protein
MKNVRDTLSNWLTIKVVSDARPGDLAAIDTVKLFESILKDDYLVDNIKIKKDEVLYHLTYDVNGEEKIIHFPVELIDLMLNQMQAEPEKFKNYE